MNSSVSRSSDASLLGPGLDPPWHTVREWAIGPHR